MHVLTPVNKRAAMPEAPLAHVRQDDYKRPAWATVFEQLDAWDMGRGERPKPRRSECLPCQARVQRGDPSLVRSDWSRFSVGTFQADGNEPLGMVVQIERPVIADELVQVDPKATPELPQSPRLKDRPPNEVHRTAIVAVDLLTPK